MSLQENINLKILVTGGAGFTGSSVVRELMKFTDFDVNNLDKLTNDNLNYRKDLIKKANSNEDGV